MNPIPLSTNLILLLAMALNAIAEHPGALVYQKLCVECHGANGQGVEGEYEYPLSGDRSIKSLAKLIEKTMPEQDESLCTGEDAVQVADYIYNTFYSPDAQQRLGLTNTVRTNLSRRTVPQHQNAIADILLMLDPKSSKHDYHLVGLKGVYFSSDGMNKKNKQHLERVDEKIDFDFKDGSPAENVDPTQFSIAWEGSLFAPTSGTYEFRVTTPNGIRLYVNSVILEGDRNSRDDSSAPSVIPLIDGWVSSGDEVQTLTEKVKLLGGRHYPIRVDYFKYLENSASIKLEWKPPHGAWAVLDRKHLSPDPASRTLVLKTSFPADDRSYGYERGNTISKGWDEATTKAAIEVSNEVLDRIDQFAQTNKNDPNRADKLKSYATKFYTAAFRRPLSELETDLYVQRQFTDAESPDIALKRCVLLALKSPRFLYTEIPTKGDKPNSFTVASRLALALWDSIPDQPLIDAATNQQLASPEQIRSQAQRMLNDPRAKEKLDSFFEHWLELDERDLTKDTNLFPQFDADTIADLRHSLELFVDDVVWGDSSDYRRLLQDSHILLNGRLAKFYGGDQNSTEFVPVNFDPNQRAGILTHPYLLSAFAYHNNTSPIHRGVFLTRNIVGRRLKPPPVAVAFKDDEFDPTLTMREKVTHLTKDTSCMSCHSVINPLGFSLESFDAVGRWRTIDNKKNIDTNSEYTTLEGETIQINGARDIANYAITSPAAHRTFITALFNHAIKQPTAAYGTDTLEKLLAHFQGNNFHIRDLLIEIATLTSLAENQ